MRPIFIGGTGRSGTTLLKSIFSCHPEVVAIEQELRIHIDPDGALDLFEALTNNWTPQIADIAIQRFCSLLHDAKRTPRLTQCFDRLAQVLGCSPSRYSTWKLDKYFGQQSYEDAVSKLLGELSVTVDRGYWAGTPPYQLSPSIHHCPSISVEEAGNHIRDFFTKLYSSLDNDHSTSWVDDTPYNILAARRLLKLFPDSLFIHIHRDPMDVLASYRDQSWGGKKSTSIAEQLNAAIDEMTEISNQLGPEVFMDISLSSLANSPQEQADRMLSFAGLNQSESFASALSEVSAAKVREGRWRNDLPKDEADICLKRLESNRAKLGYSD